MPAIAAEAAPFSAMAVSRERLFYCVFLILAANSLSGLVIRSLTETAVATALLRTFGVSAIVWVSLAAGLTLLKRSEERRSANATDLAFSTAALAMAMLPMANLSTVAMTILAAYSLCTSNAGSTCRRASAIFLAITANLMWGRLILGLFSRSFLLIDAFFVTRVIGSPMIGNTIAFNGTVGFVVVTPGCSSLQGISVAIVCWVTVNQWFSVKVSPFSLMWCGLAVLTAFAINILRIAALVNFPAYFNEIHVGWGAQLASYSTMIGISAITLMGARREVFR